ncbi:XRE family transcriptional regulator [Weissella muntiaci]|uniref:XRE family transcriptional regulator n=1 Tax=Weissella muntiaci TaxID=2508881 RepID=A0A6C2CBS5_9LACO|nr:helix-turn-helix transcriptional regulator [Weissella muntiaci]TYC50803.1 XRE family transcriptional regulator [Weissella muntiaci]
MNIQRFIDARLAAGLTQEELAQGIATQATLSRFESGGKIPSIKILTKLVNRLDISLADLFAVEETSAERVIRTKLAAAEYNLIISEYVAADEILHELDTMAIDQIDLRDWYVFVRSYVDILSEQNIERAILRLNAIVIDAAEHAEIYLYLAYTGLGMAYARQNNVAQAEQYFERSFENVMSLQNEHARTVWRKLSILFYTAEFFSAHDIETSDLLLKALVDLVSDQHVTYYLARAVYLQAQNAIKRNASDDLIHELLRDAYAFSKINRNTVELEAIEKLLASKQFKA